MCIRDSACGVQDVGQHGLGQAFNGQEVNQLTVLVELRIAGCHFYFSSTAKLKRPSSARASASDCPGLQAVSYTHLRAHETVLDLVCPLLLDNKNTYSTIHISTYL